jgi:hypothetical protein
MLTACKKKKDVLPQGEILLPRNTEIIDAEYSKKKDILVYVSTNPSQLNVFYTSQNKTDVIPLTFIPMSVSVSMDANFVVVGHDAHLTHIDINKKLVINTYDVSCEALDIVLGNNKWAYVFPKRDQWSSIRCIDLANGKEILHTSHPALYAGSKAKLHPSGKYIYAANNFLSPSDIEKYDIQGGVAVRLYDSPYHGDYPAGGNLWFSEDGKRVFLKAQTTMKLSDDKTSDMLYNGTVGLDTLTNSYDQNRTIVSLDHSAAENKLYAISTDTIYRNRPNLPFIWIYDATNLSYQRKISVLKFSSNPSSSIEPFFVFVNSKVNQLYVITKEMENSATAKWAIQVL